MSDLLEAIALADRVGAEAIERYGAEAQTRMLVEETGELLTAVARCARGRGARSDVVEECADVIIVALQVARMYSGGRGQEDLGLELERKAQRLLERMKPEPFCDYPGCTWSEPLCIKHSEQRARALANGMPASGRHG